MDRLKLSQLMGHYRDLPLQEQLASALYDYREIDTVPESIRFFQYPVGMVDPNTPERPRTRLDTCMMLANQLPMGQQFLLTGVRVLFIPDCRRHRGVKKHDEYDARRVLLGGGVRFMVQNREYLYDTPLAKFPACFPKTWLAELTCLSAEDEEPHWRLLYDPALPRMAGMAYYKMTPVLIQALQYFEVSIEHTPGPLNSTAKLGVILDGRLIREGR